MFWSWPFINFKWILVTGKISNLYKQKFKNKKKQKKTKKKQIIDSSPMLLSSLCSSSMLLSLLLFISSHFFSSKPTTRNPRSTKQNPMKDPRKKKQSYSIPSPTKPTTRSIRTQTANPPKKLGSSILVI